MQGLWIRIGCLVGLLLFCRVPCLQAEGGSVLSAAGRSAEEADLNPRQAGQTQLKPDRLTSPQAVRGWCDQAPRKYPDLMPRYRRVFAVDNAAKCFLLAADAMRHGDVMKTMIQQCKLGQAQWDKEKVAGILRDNREALSWLEKGLGRSHFQMKPLLSPMDETTELMALVKIGSLKKCLCLQALHEGRLDDSLRETEELGKLATMSLEADAGLLGWLVGLACYEHMHDMIRALIHHPKVGEKQLSRVDALIRQEADVAGRFREAMRMEFLMMANTLTMIHTGDREWMEGFGWAGGNKDSSWYQRLTLGVLIRLMFQPNRTIEAYASGMRYQVDLSHKKRSERAAVQLPLVIQQSEQAMNGARVVAAMARFNLIGEWLTRMMLPAVSSQLEKLDHYQTTRSSLLTLCALRRYFLEEGRLPSELKLLVPGYLVSVPRDPYAEGSLKYSAKALRVWSVGVDGQDAGGMKEPDTVQRGWRKRRSEEPTEFLLFVPR